MATSARAIREERLCESKLDGSRLDGAPGVSKPDIVVTGKAKINEVKRDVESGCVIDNGVVHNFWTKGDT